MPKRRIRRAARRKELQEILDALMEMFKVLSVEQVGAAKKTSKFPRWHTPYSGS